uniref:ABC transporter substrate-binding protein n=1 Tax=Desulfobacca acetoxidans TaxID=60893 RepID=A0A7V4LCQ0_9BACT
MKPWLQGFSLGMLLVALTVASGGAAAPQDLVKNILEEVMAIQTNPALEGEAHQAARAAAIRRVIQRNFDFPYMAQAALEGAYQGLSPGQRQEFTQVFSTLFQASYTDLVLKFLKKETVKYDAETLEGPRARVKTTLVRTNETIPVEYLLHQKGGGWLLYDVIVDGVSILGNYQRQFTQVVRTKSFEFLLDRMKTQIKALP